MKRGQDTPEGGSASSCREVAARSLRGFGGHPASFCWKPQIVFWPRSTRERANL